MKKLIIICLAALALAGCNYDIVDLRYHFDTAYVSIPGQEPKEVKLRSWKDYDQSDTVQVEDRDGNVYLTHYCNVVLVRHSGK